MLFDKYFDKTLWLVLAIDENNRDKIIEFIRGIPEELYIQIHEGLEKKLQLRNGEIERVPVEYLYGDVEVGNKSYEYNICDDCLELSLVDVIGPSSYRAVFKLSLISFDSYDRLGFFDKMQVGEILCNFRRTPGISLVNCDIVRYNINKTIVGLMLSLSSIKVSGFTKEFMDIKLKNIPEDITVNDIENKEGLNRVLRRMIHVKCRYEENVR